MAGPVEDLLKAVVRIVNLRSLMLACWCNECDALAVPSTVFPADIPLLGKLESLEIIGTWAFVYAIIGAIFEHMPNLRELCVETSSGDETLAMTERCIMDATVHAPSVKSFILGVETDDGPFHWNALRYIRNWKSLKRLQINAPTVVVDNLWDQLSDHVLDISDHIPVLLNGLDSLQHLTLDVRS